MKIVLLTRSLDFGGTERQLVVLARGLHERGHHVLVAMFYGGRPLEEGLREAGVPLCDLGKKGRWDLLGFLLRLIRLVRKEKPDVLYGYHVVPSVLAALLKPLFPRVRMVWGIRNDQVWYLSLRGERFLSRFADLIIVNSYRGRAHAAGYGFPKDKMIVVPNGIDTRRFYPDPEARWRIRAKWGVAEDEKLIGLVGRLTPMKDHPTFLKAAALLTQERQDVRYVCVGDGPADYRQELHALSMRLGLEKHLVWAGARGDMLAVHNALDVATSSSRGEGFPNAIGEAMACGVPCVVTDVGDCSWIVGETGVVVPPKIPEALATGWMVALARDRREMALKARLHVEENFSVERLVDQTENAVWPRA